MLVRDNDEVFIYIYINYTVDIYINYTEHFHNVLAWAQLGVAFTSGSRTQICAEIFERPFLGVSRESFSISPKMSSISQNF